MPRHYLRAERIRKKYTYAWFVACYGLFLFDTGRFYPYSSGLPQLHYANDANKLK